MRHLQFICCIGCSWNIFIHKKPQMVSCVKFPKKSSCLNTYQQFEFGQLMFQLYSWRLRKCLTWDVSSWLSKYCWYWNWAVASNSFTSKRPNKGFILHISRSLLTFFIRSWKFCFKILNSTMEAEDILDSWVSKIGSISI